ncbi:phosphoglucomutase-1-like [Babylonia areolata]|uniref:phosphoglucomutase-1-like n=1 Tax=Babylonia areolata TaxID=304850 RepID=UPI003FD2D887
MSVKVQQIITTPYEEQKPGTSGLRKNVSVFQQENYTENYVQATLTASLGDRLKGSVLIVGGDGRYYMLDAIKIIIQIAAANGVSKLIIGQNGLLSTPAVSCMVRKYRVDGAFILTASHNPGGKEGDFGIKFNTANGGPAPEGVTNAIYNATRNISLLTICPDLHCDLDIQAIHKFQVSHGQFVVQVVDSVNDYVQKMKEIFDFQALKGLFAGNYPLKMLLDSMNGVTGPYVKRIFLEELGAPPFSVQNVDPLEDFGDHHPDPNLTYAADLVNVMKRGEHAFGAAFDGDGDRNLVLGQNAFFVTPSDSLAVLASHLHLIPYFRNTGVKGYARSMPTAGAVDRVARAQGQECYEVPTGWKFFGCLMDAGRLSVFGEESFGTGSDHIREKDGVWAVLAWLQVLEARRKSVRELLIEHWHLHGRNFFTRYDYEGCDAEDGDRLMDNLQTLVNDGTTEGSTFTSGDKKYTLAKADNFSYTDPIDNSVSTNQGIRIIFTDDSRIVFRLSGTGSTTIRLYIEGYESDSTTFEKDAKVVLQPLINLALDISKIKVLTGRQEPTVII